MSSLTIDRLPKEKQESLKIILSEAVLVTNELDSYISQVIRDPENIVLVNHLEKFVELVSGWRTDDVVLFDILKLSKEVKAVKDAEDEEKEVEGEVEPVEK